MPTDWIWCVAFGQRNPKQFRRHRVVGCKPFSKTATHRSFCASECFVTTIFFEWQKIALRLLLSSSSKTVVFVIFTIWTSFSLAVIPYVEIGLDQELTMSPTSHVSKYFRVSDAHGAFTLQLLNCQLKTDPFARIRRRWMNCCRWVRRFTGCLETEFHLRTSKIRIWFAVDLAATIIPSRPVCICHRNTRNCTYLASSLARYP